MSNYRSPNDYQALVTRKGRELKPGDVLYARPLGLGEDSPITCIASHPQILDARWVYCGEDWRATVFDDDEYTIVEDSNAS